MLRLLTCVILLFINGIDSWREVQVLQSDRATSWGDWGPWDRCPNNTYARGFQLRVERPTRGRDDTAMNAVRLFCEPKDPAKRGPLPAGAITSTIGPFGDWTEIQWCTLPSSVMVGVQLRAEGNMGQRGDDTAANNIRIFCADLDFPIPPHERIEGDGTKWGKWLGEKFCGRTAGVCAIRTLVEPRKYAGDDTSMNSLDLLCCMEGPSGPRLLPGTGKPN